MLVQRYRLQPWSAVFDVLFSLDTAAKDSSQRSLQEFGTRGFGISQFIILIGPLDDFCVIRDQNVARSDHPLKAVQSSLFIMKRNRNFGTSSEPTENLLLSSNE